MTVGRTASIHARLLNLAKARDADFLGFGPTDAEALANTIREICGIAVDDGIEFDPASITVEEIREEANYGGLRVRLVSRLGKARCTVQLDVGYGDAVTPGPEEAIYPTLLDDQPAPRLRVYPRAAVPVGMPLGLSDEFARDAAKRAQWKAFLGKNRLDAPTLDEVIGEVRRFVIEPLKLARQRKGSP
ncbi:MAG: nucleotidyl transferase AbiEii/AbiGii toxin family protein [Sideroxyarcus sp.]|nr:nucleotidyl transferase AbiEii/AbiGii toxin family protein [Sideroxyarcus sp.]